MRDKKGVRSQGTLGGLGKLSIVGTAGLGWDGEGQGQCDIRCDDQKMVNVSGISLT